MRYADVVYDVEKGPTVNVRGHSSSGCGKKEE